MKTFGTFKLSCIMTYKRPGVSLSINSFVASGVTSLGVKPVPPCLRKYNQKREGKENRIFYTLP